MLRWIRRIISYSSLALAVASLSVVIERRTGEMAQVGNLCGPAMNEPCMEPRLAGGAPFPFLYDRPWISVPNAIHVVEDEFRPLPFFLNYLVFLLILLAIAQWADVRAARRERANAMSERPAEADEASELIGRGS